MKSLVSTLIRKVARLLCKRKTVKSLFRKRQTTKEKTTHVTPFTSKLFVIFYVSRSESLCFPYRKRKAPLRETYVSRQRNIKIILTSEKISFGIFLLFFHISTFFFIPYRNSSLFKLKQIKQGFLEKVRPCA